MTVLILGGTAEGRAVADQLAAVGLDPVTSLAGRVARPLWPAGRRRLGGFGGEAGLRAWLGEHQVRAVVDATHPFAERISAHAAAACAAEHLALIRLARPSWRDHRLADTWQWVGDHCQAAIAASSRVALTSPAKKATVPADATCLLTIGRQHLADYLPALATHQVLARVVQAPEFTLPPSWQVVCSRGPYTLDGERALLGNHHVSVLVTKDSGGSHTAAKLTAAAELGVGVIIIERAPDPPGGTLVSTVDDAVAAVLAQVSGG